MRDAGKLALKSRLLHIPLQRVVRGPPPPLLYLQHAPSSGQHVVGCPAVPQVAKVPTHVAELQVRDGRVEGNRSTEAESGPC